MKIIQLTAENIKKLKVIDITPSENVVEITGKNGSGKSSVLDSIYWALGGKDDIQDVPIRAGQEKARIRLDLGAVIVERKFTANGTTTITVKNAEGATFPSPQKMLDELIGKLSFDPLTFSRMGRREQLEELRRVADLSVDIDALDAATARDFSDRQVLNREAKAKRAQAAGVQIQDGLPVELVDENELLNQIQAAAEHNADIEKRRARRADAEHLAGQHRAAYNRLLADAETLRARTKQRIMEMELDLYAYKIQQQEADKALAQRASAALEEADKLDAKLTNAPPLPTPVDISDLRSKMDAAKTVNLQIRNRQTRDKIAAEAAVTEKQAKELTDKMESRERQKVKAIAESKLPVPGLGFGSGTVTLNGLPFDQASDAEQLRVSVAIAMANNPKLRVIRIRDGSLLDDDGMAILKDLARDKDFQIWIERVDSSGTIGIVMEDGEVKEAK